MFFSCNVAFASMPVFLPTIIHDMGYTALTAQALSAPPYLLAFVVVILTAYLSDRYQSRSSFIILHSLIATVGYATIALCGYFRYGGTTLRYLALFPACVGFFSAITIIITWTVNNQKSETGKGAGVAIMNVIGQVGPLVGTSVFPSEEGPWYVRGMSVCAGFMLLVGVLAGILRWYLDSQNRKNKDNTGRGEYEGVGTTKRRQTFEYML
jgi:MFS family permease